MNGIMCGLGETDFTPNIGLPLMGNLRDRYDSTGVHDPLKAAALVLVDPAGDKAAILSLDLCMLNREQTAMMRKFIGENSSIPGDHILISTTHTHAGPATLSIYNAPSAERSEIEGFLKDACQAVFNAEKNLKPATVSIGYTRETRVSFNRRLKNRDGKTLMNWETFDPETITSALGPIDPLVSVLRIDQGDKKAGALVNFALHPAILDYENTLYSADYPGFLKKGLCKIIDEDFVTLFGNGCCGNINHIDYSDKFAPRRGYAAAERVGYILASDAAYGLRRASTLNGSRIAVSREMVTLKRLPITEETFLWSKKALEKMETEGERRVTDGLPEELSAPVWIDMYEKQHHDDHAEVMVIRIGDLAIVGLPGEVFCELGMKIRKRSVAPHTMVIELANDAIGYIPDRAGYGQGGYEDTPGSMKYVKGSGEKLAESALIQIERLFSIS